jgi:hypothetical protein
VSAVALLQLTGRNRFVGASYGTQQVNRRVEEAIVAYRRGEHERLAHEMAPKDIPIPQDETVTGGLCLIGIEPVSNYILLEQTAQAWDHDPLEGADGAGPDRPRVHGHAIDQ